MGLLQEAGSWDEGICLAVQGGQGECCVKELGEDTDLGAEEDSAGCKWRRLRVQVGGGETKASPT